MQKLLLQVVPFTSHFLLNLTNEALIKLATQQTNERNGKYIQLCVVNIAQDVKKRYSFFVSPENALLYEEKVFRANKSALENEGRIKTHTVYKEASEYLTSFSTTSTFQSFPSLDRSPPFSELQMFVQEKFRSRVGGVD